MRIGFISANLVGRASGFDGKPDWEHHDYLTRRQFDLEDCRKWIAQAAELGCEGLSVWTAHCWYHTVTLKQPGQLKALAAGFGLPIYSYAGGFGLSDVVGSWGAELRENWEKTFACAAGLGVGWITGPSGSPTNKPIIGELCRRYGMKLAFENHQDENSADDILRRIEGCEEFMGVGFDTGWAVHKNFSAPDAIRKLRGRIIEVHLKDVRKSSGTCALGDGVVGIEACLDALREIGYDGWLSIEHEPYHFDPMPDVRTSVQRLRKWLGR